MTDADIKTMADTFIADLSILRSYAIRAICEDTPLTDAEEADKSSVMAGYWVQGRLLGLTFNDLVRLLFQGVFPHPSRCGCPTCRSRLQS
ncbi:MAG: hypothetical protein FI707_11570 [SAR202 cluster bacterium]|jgi:hypothetical protein|nr:hypothetical protein [SAR202 cluster bacterium]HAL46758.1 hypothetical protein [Dehalococcoidia bacterium]MDP6662489.1 hypothetical protein [SAR202 cluster bacterium]MDP6800155.1 hypothetical protein [SAR202 cluster bacterium]MQG57367.1 hypothetical protein [SAR202 cluster bacterium]|tara:strand:+ start:2142 stop:2411 length:270 start_codon:yes stop_codon:yes gene_type:complete